MFVSFEISSKNVYTFSNFLMACLLTCKTLIKTLTIDWEHELKSYNSIYTLNLASLLHAVGRLDLPANMLVAYSILTIKIITIKNTNSNPLKKSWFVIHHLKVCKTCKGQLLVSLLAT